MTREEEIINAAYNEAEVERQLKMHPQVFEQGFVAGAKWADAHPDIDVRTMAAWQSGYNEGIAKYRWISVEDELPKDGQQVATINKVGVQDVRHYSHGKWFSNFGNEYDDITHWMPLPQAPLVTDLNKKDLPPVSCQEGNILVEEKGGEND